ncbi:hypothetical protein PIB30_029045 [Stylosanthes scabra]|uniref:Uncharacterized protein n=1 Tax=Stylosanthes scabra TaxID=79078 RepID=A0ABU6QAN9_9FABA|nr:hypothetical protein [Stylosanthes scabra]
MVGFWLLLGPPKATGVSNSHPHLSHFAKVQLCSSSLMLTFLFRPREEKLAEREPNARTMFIAPSAQCSIIVPNASITNAAVVDLTRSALRAYELRASHPYCHHFRRRDYGDSMEVQSQGIFVVYPRMVKCDSDGSRWLLASRGC